MEKEHISKGIQKVSNLNSGNKGQINENECTIQKDNSPREFYHE